MPALHHSEYKKRDVYTYLSTEQIFSRWDHKFEKCFIKFLDEPNEEIEVHHSHPGFHDSSTMGTEISKSDYEAGKDMTQDEMKAKLPLR